MKIYIKILFFVVLIAVPIGIWVEDIHSDRQNIVTTLQKVPFYSDWVCGLNCGSEDRLGEIPSGNRLKVLRIRHGKDFMAIKIEFNSKSGWLIYSSGDLVLNNTAGI